MLFNAKALAVDWDDRPKKKMRDAFVVSLDIAKNKDIDKAVEGLPPGFLKFLQICTMFQKNNLHLPFAKS